MRLTAGYTTAEIATLVEAERDQIEHLALPRYGAPVSTNWIGHQLKMLRDELEEVSD